MPPARDELLRDPIELVGDARDDADRGVLVIQPAQKLCAIPMPSTAELAEALVGMAWWNSGA